MANDFEQIKNRAIEQSDRPASITRKEAENIVRGILKGNLGNLAPNVFIDSVDQLMEEINGAESTIS
jgi:hypothetical protein